MNRNTIAIHDISYKDALELIKAIHSYREASLPLFTLNNYIEFTHEFSAEQGWCNWMLDLFEDEDYPTDREMDHIDEIMRAAWRIALDPVELAEFKEEEINDTIWMVEDDAGTDVWHTVCASMEEANDEAERQWNQLTKSEKRQRSVRVIFTKLTEEFYDRDELAFYGTEAWSYSAFHSCGSSDECFNSEFLSKLYILRREANLTQQELADEADVHITTISRIERGERGSDKLTLDTAARLAEALNCHAEDLLD